MIQHINDRMVAWAVWCEQRASGALGYPKQSAFLRLGASGSHFDGVVLVSEDCWEIEQAVTSLAPDLRVVAKAVYRVRGTTEQQAAALEVSERTLYRRLHELHVAVLDWLLGYYAERGNGQGERHLRRAVQTGEAGSGAGEAGPKPLVRG